MQERSVETIVREVADAIEHEGNVKAIFGEPIELETHRIIPVARAHISMGGGGGFGGAIEAIAKAAQKIVPAGGGGGGGVDIVVEPIGFICEEEGRVLFTRIDGSNGVNGANAKGSKRSK